MSGLITAPVTLWADDGLGTTDAVDFREETVCLSEKKNLQNNSLAIFVIRYCGVNY